MVIYYLSRGDTPITIGTTIYYLSQGDVPIDITAYPTPPDAVPQSGPIIVYITSSFAVGTAGPAGEVPQSAGAITTSVGVASP